MGRIYLEGLLDSGLRGWGAGVCRCALQITKEKRRLLGAAGAGRRYCKVQEYHETALHQLNLQSDILLGEGGFGKVWRARDREFLRLTTEDLVPRSDAGKHE